MPDIIIVVNFSLLPNKSRINKTDKLTYTQITMEMNGEIINCQTTQDFYAENPNYFCVKR